MTAFDNSTLGCKISNLLLQFMNFAMRYNFTTQSFTVRAVSKGGYILSDSTNVLNFSKVSHKKNNKWLAAGYVIDLDKH